MKIFYIPEEGSVRGSDAAVILEGAKNPIAANLSIDRLLDDAKVSAENSNFIGYMGSNAAGAPVHHQGPPGHALDQARQGDRGQAPGGARVGSRHRRATRWAELKAGDLEVICAPPCRARAARRSAAISGSGARLPGPVWLALFFLVPLAFIAAVGLGAHDRLGAYLFHVLTLDNYARRSARRSSDDIPAQSATPHRDDPVIAIGYPVAYWISRYGRRNKALLLILVMLPVLDQLPHPDIHLDDRPAGNWVVNSILQGLGITGEPISLLNTDLAVILGMTYGFLPFAILPLVRVDRPTTRRCVSAAATSTPTDGRLHPRHPAADHAGDRGRGTVTFIPAIGDYVTQTCSAEAQTKTSRRSSRPCLCRGATHPGSAPRVRPVGGHESSGTFAAIRSLRTRGAQLMRTEPQRATSSAYALAVYVFLFLRIIILIIFQLQRLDRRNFNWAGVHPRLVSEPVLEQASSWGPAG